jgi:hypothetical protein
MLALAPNYLLMTLIRVSVTWGVTLFLRQTSKTKTWVLKYFHMLVAFFLQIVADTNV